MPGAAIPPPPLGASAAAGAGGPPAKSGCGLDPIPSGSGTIQVDGMARTYQFSVPQGYDKNRKYPIVFGFHGAGVPASAFRTYFNMTQVVGPDALVVYPEALGMPMAWDAKRDIPLFDALLTQFQGQYCIDDKKVFAAGHSSGGFFTHALGCQRGNVLRGIGPMSAGAPFGTCVGQIAVWISQGNADPTVKPASGQGARDFWAKRNHCDTTMSKPVDPAPTVEYAGCDPGFAVRYCEYEGDHNLPAYAPKGIWDFFKTLM
jgi:polyhydroxybutyrate depolymerase